jgi:hypothetical protein
MSECRRAETAGRYVIGGVSQDVREAQVVIVASHPRNGTVWGITLTSTQRLPCVARGDIRT